MERQKERCTAHNRFIEQQGLQEMDNYQVRRQELLGRAAGNTFLKFPGMEPVSFELDRSSGNTLRATQTISGVGSKTVDSVNKVQDTWEMYDDWLLKFKKLEIDHKGTMEILESLYWDCDDMP